MGAEGGRHVLLLGVEVSDEEGYAHYRAAMTPILVSYGGSFGCDFVVSRMLSGPPASLNRVFTLVFPDRHACTRFFADPEYRAVRSALFAPAVARIVTLGEFEEWSDPPRHQRAADRPQQPPDQRGLAAAATSSDSARRQAW